MFKVIPLQKNLKNICDRILKLRKFKVWYNYFMLKIITLPNPILRQKAKPVGKISSEIKKLVGEMIKILRPKPRKLTGVGLAAPQVGKSLRMIVVWSRHSRKFLPMINPKIIWHSKRTRVGVPESKKSLPDGRQAYEGCLSVPGVWGKVRRYSVVKIRYQNLAGTEITRKFRGFTGVVVQHEIDHLEGILFIDRIKEQKGEILTINPKSKIQNSKKF